MARIDTLTFKIDGKEYTSNVNVHKDGTFKTELHWQVSEAIGIKSPIIGSTKDAVVSPIIKSYHEYLERKTEYHLFISIKYMSNKAFFKDSEGCLLHNSTNSKFYKNGFSGIASELHFGYEIYCKEIMSTGNEVWHDVSKANENTPESATIIQGYSVGSVTYGVKGIIIPFSKQAIETLSKAKEGIRGISEILFNFLNQDVEQIQAQLNKGNLISNQTSIEN